MGLVKVFFWGMLVSFLGSLPLGTLNVAAMQISLQESVINAIYFSLGSLLTEMIYVRISLVGINWIRKHLYKSYSHTKDFLDCMRSRKKPICDVEIGCRSVTVCHLGNLAYWHHRHLQWDPVKERFVGDEEANQWLDRPKRAPWQV